MIDFNSVLMEPSCFLKPLICLKNKEKISLKDFFNLSSLIESIILHNEIYTYGVNRACYKDKLPILKSLIDENIMYFFREDDYFFRKQLQDFYSPEIKNNQNNLNEKK